jgi:indole-3-glycerol phosphate synthase
MTDIPGQSSPIKRQEVAAAISRKSLDVVRADAESRVLTRDFVGNTRQNRGWPARVIAEIKKANPSGRALRTLFRRHRADLC